MYVNLCATTETKLSGVYWVANYVNNLCTATSIERWLFWAFLVSAQKETMDKSKLFLPYRT